jgi:hypothetical protein
MSRTTNIISFDLKRCNCEVTVELHDYPIIQDAFALVRVRNYYINPMTGERKVPYVDSEFVFANGLEIEDRRNKILQGIVDTCGGYLSIAMKQRLLKKICVVINK